MGSAQARLEFVPYGGRPTGSTASRELLNNRIVIFGENTKNQVGLLLNPLSINRQEASYLKLKVIYDGGSASPVIGLSEKNIDIDTIDIEKNSSLFVWYVAKGIIEYRGDQQQLQQPIPELEPNADVTLHYVPTDGKITITVANPGKEPLSEEITTPDFQCNKLLPFVGAVATGNSKMEFHILENSSVVHTNNSLHDMTHKVMFTTSYGVVDISRDCKSVKRTSKHQGNGCALLPVKLTSGIHQWGFMVKCDFGASLCLGLARYPFMLSEEYIKDHVKHVYRHPGLLVYRSYRGLLYRDGKQLAESLDPVSWQHGRPVLIEFIFDSTRGTLEVLRNNISLGVAFRGLEGIFQPVIGFYAAYEKDVQLKHYYTTETSLETTVLLNSSVNNPSPAAVKLSEDVAFEESLIYGSINISPDKKSLFRDKLQSGNSFSLLNTSCNDLGIYRFSFIIEHDQGASTCIGVTQATSLSNVKISEIGNVYNSTSICVYRSFQGMLYEMGKEKSKKMEEFWMSGTLVVMEIKITSSGCSVSFKINATEQGVAFTDLQPPLTPVIAFYSGMEKRVTILHYEYVPSLVPERAPIPRAALESVSGLNDIDSAATAGTPIMLPIVCSSSDAAMFYPCCMRCEGTNNVISLPCKHSTVCAKDLKLGVNAPTRHCMACDEKILQVWNILVSSSSM